MRPELNNGATPCALAVLVVEDEFLIAMDLTEMLESHGARVLGPAPSVEEALGLLETERPDVALLDVNLRDGMVTPVAEALRSLRIPFVLSTAQGAKHLDRIESLANAPMIDKPAGERRLMAALKDATNGGSAGNGGARPAI